MTAAMAGISEKGSMNGFEMLEELDEVWEEIKKAEKIEGLKD